MRARLQPEKGLAQTPFIVRWAGSLGILADSLADYCTVRVTVPVAVVLPEVPVTVTV